MFQVLELFDRFAEGRRAPSPSPPRGYHIRLSKSWLEVTSQRKRFVVTVITDPRQCQLYYFVLVARIVRLVISHLFIPGTRLQVGTSTCLRGALTEARSHLAALLAAREEIERPKKTKRNIHLPTMSATMSAVFTAPAVAAAGARSFGRRTRATSVLPLPRPSHASRPRSRARLAVDDVDWDAKTKEMTAERIMEKCMEAMADGDQDLLESCLLELEEPKEKTMVLESLMKEKEEDAFWKDKLAEIAAERVLDNCMSAVVSRHNLRVAGLSSHSFDRRASRRSCLSLQRARTLTTVSPARRYKKKNKMTRSPPSSNNYFKIGLFLFIFLIETLLPPVPCYVPKLLSLTECSHRCPATSTASRSACLTPRTTPCWGWTSPPPKTAPPPSGFN